jgi:serine/threonine-protein kinase RsbW
MIKPEIRGNSIAIPSNQEFLPDVDIFIEGILRGFGADESIVADIAISVSELVNNAILHGNKSLVEKAVTVTISKGNGEVAISVADQGGGFDPSCVENPIDDANLLKEVGRGIFIVRSLMDKVEIDASNTGTTIRITKGI